MALPLILLIATLAATDAAAFDLQGHRGARGLYPENTLPAFAAALSIGVSGSFSVKATDPDVTPMVVGSLTGTTATSPLIALLGSVPSSMV